MLRTFSSRLPCAARAGRDILLAAAFCLATGQAAQAQPSFRIPQICNGLASGSEDELDPVVLITLNAGRTFLYNFRVSPSTVAGRWFVRLQNPTPDTYLFVTTYTPFLISTKSVRMADRPSVTTFLPDPGDSEGSLWPVRATYVVTVVDQNNHALPFGIVDFIPAFAGSSPYTLQATNQGTITLNCVQAQPNGYAVTVYDPNGNYLYDGRFPVDRSGASTIIPSGQAGARPTSRGPGREP